MYPWKEPSSWPDCDDTDRSRERTNSEFGSPASSNDESTRHPVSGSSVMLKGGPDTTKSNEDRHYHQMVWQD